MRGDILLQFDLHFLMISGIKQLLIHLLAICMSSLEKCILKSLTHFQQNNQVFFLLRCCCCLVAKSCATLYDPMQLFVACQAPLSMRFSRQEYCKWVATSFSRGSPYPGIELTSPALAGRFFTAESPGKPTIEMQKYLIYSGS